nr:MAG TPA: replicative DNA helicase [Caudoviricetes sp.]
MRETIKFLTNIYSQQCQPGDYVILAAKEGKSWKDIPIKFGSDLREKLRKVFKAYPPEEYDLYWSPMPFSQPKRQNQYSVDTKFLAQDIDECEDPSTLDPKPSYIWESSPNKYQGLWELDRYIEEGEYTPLNKALATHIGCDDCFDFAHVYRIPGTINHKYKNTPAVGLPSYTKAVYKPRNLRKAVGGVTTTPGGGKAHSDAPAASEKSTLIERKIYAKYSIPKKVRDLLALESLEGVDRSRTIWYVENSLYGLGMTPPEIIHLIKNSVFNKYTGRRDEDLRIQRELEKIISGEITDLGHEESNLMRISNYEEVMGNCNTFEGWLVKGFWGRRSHGIVAGMPKCFKSTLVHDLVISVASGQPFLGEFPVLEPGPVIVVQNENADYIMKDRTEKIILDRGLVGEAKRITSKKLHVEFPPDLPITFLNQQGFTLSNENHRRQIESLIKEIKPVLVVFDPLYLMFEGDLNSSKELNPVLNWLLSLKTEYKTSVMVIHHYNKGSNQQALRGGARMAGSVMLYGWVESAWYLTKTDEDEEGPPNRGIDLAESSGSSTITLTREFRMAGNYPDLDIHFEMGEIGNPSYRVTVGAAGEPHVTIKTLEDEVLGILGNSNAPVTKRALRENLGVDMAAIRKALDNLIKSKKIVPMNKGYTIFKH